MFQQLFKFMHEDAFKTHYFLAWCFLISFTFIFLIFSFLFSYFSNKKDDQELKFKTYKREGDWE